MTASTNTPKIFISYSWRPEAHKQKVRNIAERLTSDGIHVIIDIWDLSHGQDKYQFMEKMVNDNEINKVLIFSNADYAKNANEKKGGVGSESLIISSEIYQNAEQTKFVAIVLERDENGNECLPTFFKSRIYFDFSKDEVFEEQYDKLLRNIFDKPASKRPPIGSMPAYLAQEEPIFLKTAHKVSTIKNALLDGKLNVQIHINEYYDTFLSSLLEYKLDTATILEKNKVDEYILKKIDEMTPLRDDFIKFMEVLFKHSVKIDLEEFHKFWERCTEFIVLNTYTNFDSRQMGSLVFDHFRFFFYELFLYTSSLLIKLEKFEALSYILYNSFAIFNENKLSHYNFCDFNNNVYSLNSIRNERLKTNRINITADLIKSRVSDNNILFDQLKEVDCILYYISIMKIQETANNWFYKKWFPQLSVYYINTIPIIEKMNIIKSFENIKVLFDVKDKLELESKVRKVIDMDNDKISRFDYKFPTFNMVFDFKKIATIK